MTCFFPPPTLAGLQTFLVNAGFNTTVLPPADPVIQVALNVALLTVSRMLEVTGIYPLAVYNLATSLIINFAQDQPNQCFFVNLRGENGYNIAAFLPGVIAASSDDATSENILSPDFMKNLTFDDLQRLKDPYGRQYLAFAQDAGPSVIGLS